MRLHVAGTLLMAACSATQVQPTRPLPQPELALPANLASCPEPYVERESFEHTRSRLTASDPRHVAIDAVGKVGGAFEVQAKLHYGRLGVDLRDESVSVFVRQAECGEWTLVETTTTNDQGWASVELESDVAGTIDVRFVVHGDASSADAKAYVLEEGTEVVVFDVDGTLTVDDNELVSEVIDPQYDPRAHPGSVEVAQWHRDQGAFVMYITGRPYFFAEQTRRWLERRGVPEGPLLMTRTIDEARGGVQRYKREALERLTDELKFAVPLAYGNAMTDVCAYAEAEIPAPYIVGLHAGAACPGHSPSIAVDSYPEHLESLRAD